jgi:hypothetical protein
MESNFMPSDNLVLQVVMVLPVMMGSIVTMDELILSLSERKNGNKRSKHRAETIEMYHVRLAKKKQQQTLRLHTKTTGTTLYLSSLSKWSGGGRCACGRRPMHV